MGKVKDNTKLTAVMNRELTNLKSITEDMDEKRGSLFIDWLSNSNKYLQWETTFNPQYLRAYKRAEIVLANFGFNVGSEFGGMHFAVIVKNSSKSNPIVNVVPLSSLNTGETEEDIHNDDVFLGVIAKLNEKEVKAIPSQLRPISKLRIYKPKVASDGVFKLSPDQMDDLDDKIRRIYTILKQSKQHDN